MTPYRAGKDSHITLRWISFFSSQRVLDTLIRDGADVHRQNKFKNTPHDVANSAECRGILRRAEAIPAPSAGEAEKMHHKNLQVGQVN